MGIRGFVQHLVLYQDLELLWTVLTVEKSEGYWNRGMSNRSTVLGYQTRLVLLQKRGS